MANAKCPREPDMKLPAQPWRRGCGEAEIAERAVILIGILGAQERSDCTRCLCEGLIDGANRVWQRLGRLRRLLMPLRCLSTAFRSLPL